MDKSILGGVGLLAGAVLLGGCQCTPPSRGYVETRTEVEIPKACPPAKTTTVTVIHRPADTCAAVPPVGEITVVRTTPARVKMVFVNVRPSDDRCFNPETRNFERPWPSGPFGMGSFGY